MGHIYRRQFLAATGALFAAGLAHAQQSKKIFRVGWLSIAPRLQIAQLVDAFEQGIRDAGFVVGKNPVIEFAIADNKIERLPELALALVAKNVDVIVCGSNPNIVAAKAATQTIPIVFAVGSNVVESGLVKSLARPGGNVTGLTWDVGSGFNAKRFELLKEAAPGIRRVAVLYDTPPDTFNQKVHKAAATALGLHLIEQEIMDDFARTFADLALARVDAVIVYSAGKLYARRAELVALAAKHRMATGLTNEESVAAGGLMSYSPSLPDLFRRAAGYVSKIMKGARPADLPVEQPIKLDLVINLKTATALGLKIPQTLLLRADRVIE